MAARWLALATYTAAVYGFLPFGPRIGITLGGTAAGAWLLGPGLTVLTMVGTLTLVLVLVRRVAPPHEYAMLLGAALGYVVAFSWLRGQHLERTHLPEYGIAACLAWWALAPSVPAVVPGYVAAAGLAAAIGYGDELLQRVVPGRVYDLRDVGMNAVGAVLGTLVLAAARAGARPPAAAVASATRVAERLDDPSLRP